MKKSFITTTLLLLSFCIKAQSIPLPNSVGQYIFDLIINRADISKSEISTDVGSYTTFYKKIWLPALQEELRNASESEKIFLQFEIDDISLKAETFYDENQKNWAALMQNADRLKINYETATYNKTFFRFSRNQDSEYPIGGIDLYIGLNHEDAIYAFHLVVQWVDNRWIVIEIDPDLYRYTQNEYDDVVFLPETTTSEASEDISYKYNTKMPSTMEETKTITPINTFSQKILNLLKASTPFGSDNMFLTEDEYMETQGNTIIKQLRDKKEKGKLEEDFLEEINSYLDNPSLLFENELKEPWAQLQETLNEEFDGNMSNLSSYETEVEVYNWDNKFIEMDNIIARIRMNFEQNDHNAGIIFDAVWYNGVWKLSYVQPFPYGISSAETEEAISVEEATESVEEAISD